ncbi:Transcription factor TGA4 [Spatholobus suberectus]|nr:Transcription factor TGA4 [Spatholobus suberectus]
MFASTPEQDVQQSFEAFYEGWLARQENLLEQLLSVMPDAAEQQRTLIEQALCHYQQFLEEKSKVANDDVFLLFPRPWLSAYERALLWIGDYKPSLPLFIPSR